jgi:hypothetical protein
MCGRPWRPDGRRGGAVCRTLRETRVLCRLLLDRPVGLPTADLRLVATPPALSRNVNSLWRAFCCVRRSVRRIISRRQKCEAIDSCRFGFRYRADSYGFRIGVAMTTAILVRAAKRLVVILMFAWVLDTAIVQNLPDRHFDTGKSVEIVLLLALAWRYCMPPAPRIEW